MRALTVRPPWSEAIRLGLKRVENRSRNPGCQPGEWVAIHAGLQDHVLADECYALAPETRGCPRGAIVALARIAGVKPASDVPPSVWVKGPFCVVIDQVLSLADPVPTKGALGLWTVPPAVAEVVLDRATAP